MDRYAIWRSRTALTGFLTKNSTGGTVGRLKLGKARLSCYDQRMFLDAQAGTATFSDAPYGWPSEEQDTIPHLFPVLPPQMHPHRPEVPQENSRGKVMNPERFSEVLLHLLPSWQQ